MSSLRPKSLSHSHEFLSCDRLFSFSIDQGSIDHLCQEVSTPYLQIGIKKGGCSGSRYEFAELGHCDDSLMYVFAIAPTLRCVVSHADAQIFKALTCFSQPSPGGVLLIWSHQTLGPVCGCGDSFAAN